MDKSALIVPVIAGILGVLSAILGFAAEATRINVDDLIVTFWGCEHPYSPAYDLVIAATLLLLITQIILTVSTGCCCKSRKVILAGPTVWVSQAGRKRSSAIIMIIASWITLIISCIMFINGAIANTPGGQVDYDCMTVKGGIFATASILALATVGLGIGASFLFQNTTESENPVINPVNVMSNLQQYPQQAGNVQMQFQYPQQAGTNQMRFQYPQQAGTDQMQFQYPQQAGTDQMQFQYPQQAGTDQMQFQHPQYYTKQAGNVQMQFQNPQQYPQQADNSDQMQLHHAGSDQTRTQSQDSQQYAQQAGNDHTEFQQGNTSQNPSAQIQQHNNYPPPGTIPAGYGYNTMTNM